MTQWRIFDQEWTDAGGDVSGTKVAAELLPNGDVKLSGYDYGQAVEDAYGDWDYEYWITIPAKDLARALAVFARHAMAGGAPLKWSDMADDLRAAIGPLDEGSWI